PPYCYREVYGIDTYRQGEMLLAWEGDCDPKRMAQIVEADSLNYLSLQETKRSIIRAKRAESPLTEDSFHAAPFDGIYADGMGDYEKAAA
ncbi:MAG TPA: hypothetical protein VK255_00090, partial [Patescibacteria group bacterium]|nr:hypothetical protein [Patescibacteria group bacterium]